MDAYQIIRRPLVTEKGTHQSQYESKRRGGAYIFEVEPTASKGAIKDAIEKIYGVRVLKVRTQVRQDRTRVNRYGVIAPEISKKATVVLQADSRIDLF